MRSRSSEVREMFLRSEVGEGGRSVKARHEDSVSVVIEPH